MPEAAPDEDRSNVVDLMAPLKKSLGQATTAAPAAKTVSGKAKGTGKAAAASKQDPIWSRPSARSGTSAKALVRAKSTIIEARAVAPGIGAPR